ncbi:MAG: HTH-type transcriptional activator RhaS [Pseudomonas citronellolis]|nr:MAG: HTH-type transcriptional activator RhaS [Pseudomonas citronellolis]
MQPSPWHGELWLARDFALLLGHSGHTVAHAHYAHQALLALEQPVRLRRGEVEEQGGLLLIGSMQPHALLPANQRLLTVFAEPLAFSLEGLAQVLQGAAANLEDIAERLQRAPRQPLDPRVERALAALDERLDGRVRAAELAEQAHLSLSQLERLFAGQVGLSVRRLVLWRRLRVALGLALAGEILTDAAHAAGFADAAHCSRTVRATFGIRADRQLRHLRVRLLAQCPA